MRQVLRVHVHRVVARPLISIQQRALGDLRAGNPNRRQLMLGQPSCCLRLGTSQLLSDRTIIDTDNMTCRLLATGYEPLLLDLTSTRFLMV